MQPRRVLLAAGLSLLSPACTFGVRAPVRVHVEAEAHGRGATGVRRGPVEERASRGRAEIGECHGGPERRRTEVSDVRSVPLLGAGIATIAVSPAVSMLLYAPVHAASPNTKAGSVAAVVGLLVPLAAGIPMTILGGQRVKTVEGGDVGFYLGPGSLGLEGRF